MISSTIINAMYLFIPKFRLRSHQYPKWFSAELRHQLKCLHTLRKKYKHSPSARNFERLCMAEAQFQKDVSNNKSRYEAHLINSYASRSSFKLLQHINSITKSKSIPSVVYHNKTAASNDKDCAALFNQFFHSVFFSDQMYHILKALLHIPIPFHQLK